MQPRWNHAGPAAQSKGRKQKPNGAQNEPGAGSQGITLSFQSREKNVLDIPSYRTGDFTQLLRKAFLAATFFAAAAFTLSTCTTSISPLSRSHARPGLEPQR